jgi:hypothetical protein
MCCFLILCFPSACSHSIILRLARSPFQSGPTAAPLIWKQQGLALVGDAEESGLGYLVALSKDTRTVVMGAPRYNNDTGYVVVYCTGDNSGNRTQLSETIYGNATNDWFGFSVDITADDMTILCGSPVDDGPGYVRGFSLLVDSNDDLDTATWKQIGQDIIGEANSDQFGYSVSISKDGKTIAVGADWNDGDNGVDSGYVRIYRLEEDDGTRWEQIGQDIDKEAADNYSGASVSLSADGMTVAIGSPWNAENGVESGQVRVYRIDGHGLSWEWLGQVIYGNNASEEKGYSVLFLFCVCRRSSMSVTNL